MKMKYPSVGEISMKKAKHVYLGFDLGASSGRAVLGTIENRRLTIQQITRFPNSPCRLGDRLYWNVLALWGHNGTTPNHRWH